jgi:hypothetical protein
MRSTSLDVYVAGFLARCDAMPRPDQTTVDGPGLHGLLPASDDPRIRLLVTDDRVHDALSALLIDARAGFISVSEAAALRRPPRRRCRVASWNRDGDGMPGPPRRAHDAAARRI